MLNHPLAYSVCMDLKSCSGKMKLCAALRDTCVQCHLCCPWCKQQDQALVASYCSKHLDLYRRCITILGVRHRHHQMSPWWPPASEVYSDLQEWSREIVFGHVWTLVEEKRTRIQQHGGTRARAQRSLLKDRLHMLRAY